MKINNRTYSETLPIYSIESVLYPIATKIQGGKNVKAKVFAILAAVFYAVNIPLSKLLLTKAEPTMLAAFLYLGAGTGMVIYLALKKVTGKSDKNEPLTRKDFPYVCAMVILDIAAPILLMLGVARTTSSNASLLNNFEIVATSLIALIIFKEFISKKLWTAIILVTTASVILSLDSKAGAFTFNEGSILILAACTCWGFENNCTKMISSKSSEEIVAIKGCFSGIGSLIIASIIGEKIPALNLIAAIMILGFVSYGLSINFYIMAQKDLGAAKTSAYYSIVPFLGVIFSMILIGEQPSLQFYIALLIMIAGTVLIVKDTIELQHTHMHTHIHCHEHSHGNIVHTHPHEHTHSHIHTHDADHENHKHSHNFNDSHIHSHSAV